MSIIFGKPLLTIGRKEHYLYRYGNLCIPNSGGWEIGTYKHIGTSGHEYVFQQDNNVNITFNSDNILIDTRNNNDKFKTLAIRNKIDISFRPFSKIEIEYNTSNNNNKYGNVYFTNTDKYYASSFLLLNSPSDTIITEPLEDTYYAKRIMITFNNGGYLTIKSIKLIEK